VQALKREYLGNAGSKIFSLLRYSEVQKVTHKDNYQTWALLVLALWMERHEFDA
jgi:hypothetical protein